MPFLSESQLKEMNFKYLGKNVKISNKATFYRTEQISIGDNSRIDDFCVVTGPVTIGKNVHIAIFCNVSGGQEGIIMEDFSGLAFGVHVFSTSDDYTGESLTNPTVPAEFRKKERREKIIIKKHVIVGTNSIIFPGVVLEEGCSIGAMSMVTKSTEPWKMYFGVPAKPYKDRSKTVLELEKEYYKKYGNK